MAKKVTTPVSRSTVTKAAAPAKVSTPAPASTPVRNSAIPKAQPKVITYEMVAKRAYEISQSPLCGSETDNWYRAERELKGL
jgi:hypothetical protein